MTELLAGAFAAAAVLGMQPVSGSARPPRGAGARPVSPGPAVAAVGVRARLPPPGVRGVVAAGCASCVVGVVAVGVVPVLASAILGAAVAHVVRRERAAAAWSARSQDWQSALARLAAALRSGASVPTALELAGDAAAGAAPGRVGVAGRQDTGVAPRLRAAAAMIRLGGDPRDQLLAGAGGGTERVPADLVAARLAAALGLAYRLGAAPGPVLVHLAEVEAASEQGRRDGRIALATVRATTRLLAVLPIAGLGLGALLGVASVHFLLTALAGKCCLLAASVLEAVGLLWVQALVRDEVDG